MKNLKKAIIILVIIIIAIIILLISILTNKVEEEKTNEYESQLNITLEEGIALVDNKREFFAVANKINSYLQEENDVIKDMTYSKYLNGIDEKDLKEKINGITPEEIYSPEKIYCFKKSFDFSIYYVSSVISKINEDSIEERKLYNILLLDRENMTFAIVPTEEISDEKMIQKKLEEYEENKIIKNDNNSIQFSEVSDESVCRRYLANYKSNMLYNPEKAYELLDEEYRNKRFGNIDNYKSYINENKEAIRKITLDKYKFNDKNGYIEYIVIDNNGNYYIFKETAIMQYKVIADVHTLDLEEFVNKYNSGDEIQKVGMNIEKIMDALNTKDYGYVYSKLANSYKAKNFPTYESFEEYARNMFVGVNSIEYIEHDQEGENYLYSIIFKDSTGQSIIRIEKTIIMQLKDNNDFIFSFNLDNDGLIDENPD